MNFIQSKWARRGAILAAPLMLATMMILPAGNAYASLIGSTVNSQYYAYGAAYNGYGSPATFTANGTVQQNFDASGVGTAGFSLTVSGDQIIYAYSGNYSWSNSQTSLDSNGLFIQNGNLLSFSGVNILGVTLDPSSTMSGFTASNITFNSSAIAVNWPGLSWTDGTLVVLDVTTVATPESGTLALLGIGLAMLLLCFAKFRRGSEVPCSAPFNIGV